MDEQQLQPGPEPEPRGESVQMMYHGAMINIVKTDPWVPINFRVGGKDKEFKLEYSYGAVKRTFRSTGKNLNLSEITTADLADTDVLCRVLADGLQTHQPDVTLEQVEDMLCMRHRLYYAHCIQVAFRATQPDLDFINRTLEKEVADLPTEFPLAEALPL